MEQTIQSRDVPFDELISDRESLGKALKNLPDEVTITVTHDANGTQRVINKRWRITIQATITSTMSKNIRVVV